MPARALISAVELDVFTELAGGPLSLEQLSERTGVHPRPARDFFDSLVAMGLLERERGVYANTASPDTFLDRSKQTYVGGRFKFWASIYRTWGQLTDGLRTGRPQNLDEGDLFDDLYRDSERMREFLWGMAGGSVVLGKAISATFPWSRYRSFADIGCALGAFCVQVAAGHEHLTGIGFDLPEVERYFQEYVGSSAASRRVRFHAGDFFSDPLPKADVLVMGRILHDWGLEQKRALIAEAFDALPPGGALIVYESLIDDERRTNLAGLMMSLNMMMVTREGFDFTAADCRGWMKEAGFSQTYSEPLTKTDSMVVGIK